MNFYLVFLKQKSCGGNYPSTLIIPSSVVIPDPSTYPKIQVKHLCYFPYQFWLGVLCTNTLTVATCFLRGSYYRVLCYEFIKCTPASYRRSHREHLPHTTDEAYNHLRLASAISIPRKAPNGKS